MPGLAGLAQLLGRSSSSSKLLAWGLRLDYDCMCSEMDFTPEKSFSSNYKNSQLLLTADAAVKKWPDSNIAEALKALKMHF